MNVVLAGNQNSGKSLLFNVLTGMNQTVGNWPGVTIERKEGRIRGTDIDLTDLPGIYSLSPYTNEEKISRNYIINNDVDVILNIIDSTSIERALYLTTQLLELGKKVVVALNMEDILEKKGYKIDVEKLEEMLNTTIVPVSALKKKGIKELIGTLKDPSKILPNKKTKIYSDDVEALISDIEDELSSDLQEKRFVAVKIIERDPEYYNDNMRNLFEDKIRKLEVSHKVDSEQLIADQRYAFVVKVRDACVKITPKKSLTERVDKVLLNKYFAIPIFILVMAIVYFLSVGMIGGMTVGIVDGLFNGMDTIEMSIPFVDPLEIPLSTPVIGLGPWLSDLIGSAGGSAWAQSLVADGVVAGVGAVCNFIPELIILFTCLSLLETIGYMSRVTFLFDRAFRKLGMSGKSLISFIVGSGCSVPAIMSTRTIEEEKERDLTITLVPFIPCSAKLAIITAFIGGLFTDLVGTSYTWLVTLSIYFLAIVIIIIGGFILNKIKKVGTDSSYIIELPEYHTPSGSYILRDVSTKTFEFVKRAGTIIFLSSVVVWVLLHIRYDFTFIDYPAVPDPIYALEEIPDTLYYQGDYEKYGELYAYLDQAFTQPLITNREEIFAALVQNSVDTDESLLAYIGKGLMYFFYPMLGLNLSWGASVSALQGLVAKEAVVSSMEVITAVQSGSNIFLTYPDVSSALVAQGVSTGFSFFNGFSAYGYMTFVLFSAPCFAAIGATRKELGSWKKAWAAILFQTGTAYVIGSLIGIWGALI